MAYNNEDLQQLDKVIEEIKKNDINPDNVIHKEPKGVGDVISNVFSYFGITDEWLSKFTGMAGCGCQERKKFLNNIFPLRNNK